MNRRVVIETDTGIITAPNQEAADEFVAHMKRSEELHRRRVERWGKGNMEQMRRLAALFPSMIKGGRTIPRNRSIRYRQTAHMATYRSRRTSGSIHAAKFLLQVWNCDTDWREVCLGIFSKRSKAYKAFKPFNVARALGCWDAAHSAAFLSWVELPFFP